MLKLLLNKGIVVGKKRVSVERCSALREQAGFLSGSITVPLPPSRRLNQSGDSTYVRNVKMEKENLIPYGDVIGIKISFGLVVDTAVPMFGSMDASSSWKLMPGFDLKNPNTQRAIWKFCVEPPPEVKVMYQWCWLENFKVCLYQHDQRFPVRAEGFNDAALGLCGKVIKPSMAKYIMVKDNEVIATHVSLRIGLRKSAPSDEISAMKALWDVRVNEYKDYGGFHASATWVQVESQNALVEGIGATMAVLLVLAFIGMIVFTRSWILSVIVVAFTMLVVLALFFFVIIVMGWNIGMLEGIAVVYFIGYAVTYSLHIAHMYAATIAEEMVPPELTEKNLPWGSINRFLHTSVALKSIGGATLGSGITTAGASFFLVFCTLRVFQRLGSMCLTVTVVSVIVALVPLPAGLLIFGPRRPGQCWQREENRTVPDAAKCQ